MNKYLLTIIICAVTSFCFGQTAKDTVSIYWPNAQLKYRSICCSALRVPSPDSPDSNLILTRQQEMWDKDGNEIYYDEYIKTYKDIVVLEEKVGIGKDEQEYRDLISKANNAFKLIDVENADSINLAIEYYVKAKEKIPGAVYPEQKLQEINELINKN
jgi:hypothetical protein